MSSKSRMVPRHRASPGLTLKRHGRRVDQEADARRSPVSLPERDTRASTAREQRRRRTDSPARAARSASDERRIEEHRRAMPADRVRRASRRRNVSSARFHRTIRSSTSTHDETVVERLEDVLVELAHPAELFGLEMQLAIQPAVLDGRRHLAGHRRQQREVLAVERLVRRPSDRAPERRSPRPSNTQGTK